MQRLFELLPQVADSLSTVLIEGESGTGKELSPERFTASRAAASGVSWRSTAAPCGYPARIRVVRLQGGRLHRRSTGQSPGASRSPRWDLIP